MAVANHPAFAVPRELREGSWRHLVTPPRTGAENMALDEALMERARRTGECVLRVYAWSRPTLSFGRHQAARGRVDPAAAAARGVALVRRPTGGRALLHWREVTYSVTAPLGPRASARDWYDGMTGILLAALRGMGVPAEPAGRSGRTPAPGTAACFVQADAGEIAVRGRKLVGSALLRQDGALLQHGSILIEDDQPLLAGVLPGGESPPEPAATLRETLGRTPAADEIARSLIDALHDAVRRPSTALTEDSGAAVEAERLAVVYASDDWTFRY